MPGSIPYNFQQLPASYRIGSFSVTICGSISCNFCLTHAFQLSMFAGRSPVRTSNSGVEHFQDNLLSGTRHGSYPEHSTPLVCLRKTLHGYLKGVPSPHLTSHSLAPGRRLSFHSPRPSYISSDLLYHGMHPSMPQFAPFPP